MTEALDQKPLGPFRRTYRPVFIASVLVIAVFLGVGMYFSAAAEAFFSGVLSTVNSIFGWYYALAVTFFLVFALALMISPWGGLRLGDPGEKPDFGIFSWFAMLFSAGMGIGLLFWGVSEPLTHYASPPGPVAEASDPAVEALRYTFFHWGLHAWGVYVVTALALAYFGFRKGLPLSVRSAFYPLIGDRIYGPIGDVIDTFTVFSTMFGVVTSLGLGVIQVNSGLASLTGMPESVTVQILLIAGITALATTSVVMGLDKGIRRLSVLNISLGILLIALTLMFALGMGLGVGEIVWRGIKEYVLALPLMSVRPDTLGSEEWRASWTTFYWGWWIAWAPFVGMFIARISRGRTIRVFIFGNLIAPTILTLIWLGTFGGTALELETSGAAMLSQVAQESPSKGLFEFFGALPLTTLMAGMATLVLVTFFVTSSDSGSLVIDMITAGGDPDPPRSQRIFWAVSEGVVAALLLSAGGLQALQAASVSAGLPFSIIMLFMCAGLVAAIINDRHRTVTA